MRTVHERDQQPMETKHFTIWATPLTTRVPRLFCQSSRPSMRGTRVNWTAWKSKNLKSGSRDERWAPTIKAKCCTFYSLKIKRSTAMALRELLTSISKSKCSNIYSSRFKITQLPMTKASNSSQSRPLRAISTLQCCQTRSRLTETRPQASSQRPRAKYRASRGRRARCTLTKTTTQARQR